MEKRFYYYKTEVSSESGAVLGEIDGITEWDGFGGLRSANESLVSGLKKAVCEAYLKQDDVDDALEVRGRIVMLVKL